MRCSRNCELARKDAEAQRPSGGHPACYLIQDNVFRTRHLARPPRGTGPQDLSGTAMNPNITNLALPLSDPPTFGEVQQILDKLNELMNALRRPV